MNDVTETVIGEYEYVRDDRTIDRKSVTAYTGGEGSPHVAVTAGVHGNEVGPQRVAQQLVDDVLRGDFSGRLTIIPRSNVFACIEGERESKRQYAQNESEEGDLNRLFHRALDAHTGETDRTRLNREEQIAHDIIRFLDEGDVDYLIDMHAAAWPEVKAPQVRYKTGAAMDDAVVDEMDAMARHAGLPYLMRSDATGSRAGMLSVAAPRLGIPTVTVEIGGAERTGDRTLRFGEDEQQQYMDAVTRLLRYTGTLDEDVAETEVTLIGDLEKAYANTAGLVEYSTGIGEAVEQGDLVARIHGPDRSGVKNEVVAPTDGILEARIEKPDAAYSPYHGPVDQGTRLFNIARYEDDA